MTGWPAILARAEQTAHYHKETFRMSGHILIDNRRPGDVDVYTGRILNRWTMGGPIEWESGSVCVTPNQALAALAYGWNIDDRFAAVQVPNGPTLVVVSR